MIAIHKAMAQMSDSCNRLALQPGNSFNPPPYRGVGHVPALLWHASVTSLQGGLTQA